MKSIEEYLIKLQSYFEEDDMEGFLELKEDLLEQLEDQLAEGQTEEQVVQSLSDPERVAEDYFIEVNLETISNVKTSVISRDELDDELKRTIKKSMSKYWFLLLSCTKNMLFISGVALFIFFLVYIVAELITQQHLALIPLFSNIAFAGIILYKLQPYLKLRFKTASYITIACLAISAGGFLFFGLKQKLFYQGIDYFNEYTLTSSEKIKMALTSDSDVEFSVIQVSENEPFRLMVRGRFTQKDVQNMENNHYQETINLSLDENNWLNLFTRTGKSEILLFVPENHDLAKLSLDLSQGDIRLISASIKELTLNMDSGDVYAKELVSNDTNIINNTGDVVIENSEADISLTSSEGKTVINGNDGNLNLSVINGTTILKKLKAKEVGLQNHNGKLVLEEGEINSLSSQSTTGSQVIKYVKGNIKATSGSGKIVVEETSGNLIANTDSGVIIVVQTEALAADINSKSGFIKWLQSPNKEVAFKATSKNGTVGNHYESPTLLTPNVSITSQTGDIKIIPKK